MRIVSLLILLSLLAPPPASAGLRECFDKWGKLLSPSHRIGSTDIHLSERQREHLSRWARETDGKVHYFEDHALLAFSDLPRAIRQELFTRNGVSLTQRQLHARWEALGVDSLHRVLRAIRDIYVDSAEGKYEAVEQRIHRILTADPATLRGTRRELNRRVLIGRIVETLGDQGSFEIKIDGNEVVFPDGQRNRLVKKTRDGTLLVEFDYQEMLRTQDYFNGKIFAEYVASREGDGVGFDGDPTPDGRLMILDGHHRTAAYAHRHGGKVLGRIPRRANGTYLALSHLNVMNFYQPHWGFSHWYQMTLEELQTEWARIKRNPGLYLKEPYYKAFQGRKLDSLMCLRPAKARSHLGLILPPAPLLRALR